MHKFIRRVHTQARKNPKRIVFPESMEERTLSAVAQILKKNIAKPVLLGPSALIKKQATKLKLKMDWNKVKIIDPARSKLTEKFAAELYKLRKDKDKGLTKPAAKKLIQDINYFGAMCVHMDEADGMVTGTLVPTSESLRPALQIIRTKERFHKVSGIFFMILKNRLLLFADAVVTINPNSHDLVDIAADTAKTAKRFGLKPRIAFLSFSTKGSSNDPSVDKIREAVSLLKYEHPDLIADGEMQVDAALVPKVARRKCPDSVIQGDANILIFPGLESANISYKLVERLAKAEAIGPLLQGLKKPVNDLSRGCSIEDIVNATAFTACECQENE